MPKKKTHEQFVMELKNISKNIEVLTTYCGCNQFINAKCLKCHTIWSSTPARLLNGACCPICNKHYGEEFLNANNLWVKISHVAKWLLNPEDGYRYTMGSNVKVDWKCPTCSSIIHNKEISKVVDRGKVPCPICSDGISYPEKIMFSLLTQLRIEFETEKTFSWSCLNPKDNSCKVRYDFYFKLDNQEYVAEVDGRWHFQNNEMNGQTKEESFLIDLIKDNLARQHNIIPIRIDCKLSDIEYIKENILNSELSQIFILDNVDWIKCHIDGISSHKIKAAELWNVGKTTGEIADIMKRCKLTIGNWLKDCAAGGLCDYTPQYGRKRRKKKAADTIAYNAKKVVCIETNMTNNSIKTAAEETNTQSTLIVNCCKGRRETAGRFHWEYVS